MFYNTGIATVRVGALQPQRKIAARQGPAHRRHHLVHAAAQELGREGVEAQLELTPTRRSRRSRHSTSTKTLTTRRYSTVWTSDTNKITIDVRSASPVSTHTVLNTAKEIKQLKGKRRARCERTASHPQGPPVRGNADPLHGGTKPSLTAALAPRRVRV
ncbi:hypothetical protein QJS66_21290 [Kocuria rhizophila]|nr:hypothetical protein QJS66_21290 [Kocuria rhizophila]